MEAIQRSIQYPPQNLDQESIKTVSEHQEANTSSGLKLEVENPWDDIQRQKTNG